jgi:hypothetical protein
MIEQGDTVRLRPLGSTDEWCVCIVEVMSPNQQSAGLKIIEGVFRPRSGGMVLGAIPVSFTETAALFAFTGEELEMELWAKL